MGDRPSLLVVGAATRDIDERDPRGWRLGGTVTYASLTAARMGVQVRALVGVDAEAADAQELGLLTDAGAEIRLVALERGPVFDNRPTATGRERLAHQASDGIRAASLPEHWRASSAVVLGPVAGELGDDWAFAFADDTFVALGWQGLLRQIVPGQPVERLPPSRTPLVERADALLLSSEDVIRAEHMKSLLRERQTALLTQGRHGAIGLRLEDGHLRGRMAPALSARNPVDSTGAGDVFLGAWLATRLLAPDAGDGRHLLVASAMAGRAVTTPTLGDLPGRRELCEVLVRLRDRQLG